MTRLIILIVTILFPFNSDICDFFYDSAYYYIDINGKEISPWWQLRFKIKSVLRGLLLIALIINVKYKTKILMLPLLCVVLIDIKDRVLFSYTDRDYADIIIYILCVIYAVYIYYKNGIRSR